MNDRKLWIGRIKEMLILGLMHDFEMKYVILFIGYEFCFTAIKWMLNKYVKNY